jgi:hypothetical protein
MDRCFKEEKDIKRKENLRKAREADARFQETLKKLDSANNK